MLWNPSDPAYGRATSPFMGGKVANAFQKPLLKGEVAPLKAGSEGFHRVDSEL
jgi:hypothetical protein